MDELKQALEDMLFLIDRLPMGAFEDGVVHQGMDEGEVLAGQVIDKARYVLFKSTHDMDEIENAQW